MRLERLAENAGAHAARCQQDFDDKVIAAELARDAEWQSGGGMRVVETWHAGNFAYAAQRGSQIDSASIDIMREAMQGAVILPLRIGKNTAMARMREKAADVADEKMAEFFLSVASRAESAAREWGATVLPALSTESAPPEETAAAAVATLAARYDINTKK